MNDRENARHTHALVTQAIEANTDMKVLSWEWSRDIATPGIVTITITAAPRALAELQTMTLPATALGRS